MGMDDTVREYNDAVDRTLREYLTAVRTTWDEMRYGSDKKVKTDGAGQTQSHQKD